jgi:hypothetical protein
VGPKGKHDPERTAVRHGHEAGEVTLGVGHDDGGAAAWLKQRHDVLDEVELLIACLDDEVVAIGRLISPSSAERRVRQNDVEASRVSRRWNRRG